MTKEMIISSSAHETRVAILEDDQVAEIFIEREHQRGVAGNLYKGRVSKVLPGMQSAFVDLGLERDGFLYVADKEEGLVVIGNKDPKSKNIIGVGTLLDGDPANNFLERAATFNPDGILHGARRITIAGRRRSMMVTRMKGMKEPAV